jgi:hypothetical protein
MEPIIVTEVIGRLDFHEELWTVKGVEFTIDGRKNPWVLRNLKKMNDWGYIVVCKLNQHKELLSVRVETK